MQACRRTLVRACIAHGRHTIDVEAKYRELAEGGVEQAGVGQGHKVPLVTDSIYVLIVVKCLRGCIGCLNSASYVISQVLTHYTPRWWPVAGRIAKNTLDTRDFFTLEVRHQTAYKIKIPISQCLTSKFENLLRLISRDSLLSMQL